jgi:gamma-hexachlorocyclohexane dehydrochlorinase
VDDSVIPSQEAMATELDRLASRAAISDLIFNYCHSIDARDVGLFMSIWHPDAAWRIGPPYGEPRGTREIERTLVELVLPPVQESHHWATNIVITFEDANHARALSSVHCQRIEVDGSSVLLAANYRDQFERREGHWRFLERAIDLFTPLPDSVHADLTTGA